MDFASLVFIVFATAAGIVPLVRQISYVKGWMLAGIKPWVCDLCMSFWSTLISSVFWSLYFHTTIISAVPSFAITFLIVRKNSEPMGPPPSLPDLKDMDDG